MTTLSLSEKQNVLQIGLCNFSEKSSAAIDVFLHGASQLRGRIVAAQQADIIILDLDIGNPNETWLKYRQRFPTQPTVAISVSDQPVAEAICVKKPVKPALLLEAIAHAAKMLQSLPEMHPSSTSQPVSAKIRPIHGKPEKPATAPDVYILNMLESLKTEQGHKSVEPRNPAETKPKPALQTGAISRALEEPSDLDLFVTQSEIDPDEINIPAHLFYDPTLKLQGLIADTFKLAQADGRSRVIEGLPAAVLVIPDNSGWVMTQLNAQMIRSVGAQNLSNRKKINVRDLIQRVRPVLLPKMPVENFLWLAALAAARGRVPVGTDLHAPVGLKHWPNFTRLEPIPHAMRIAALWLEQPTGLLETAARLHIPQRYVFAFYSAAHAIGLVTVDKTSSVSVNAKAGKSVPTQQEHRSFLGKLLSRLMRN